MKVNTERKVVLSQQSGAKIAVLQRMPADKDNCFYAKDK